MDTIDRAKAYVYSAQQTPAEEPTSSTDANKHQSESEKSSELVLAPVADNLTANTVFLNDKALFNEQPEFTSLEQAMVINDAPIPMESTTTAIDER
jgi:hypothetical protein